MEVSNSLDVQKFIRNFFLSLLESEFWLALGKATLAVGVIAFTFVTMVGGNPLHYTYGFRNWDREEIFLVYLISLLIFT